MSGRLSLRLKLFAASLLALVAVTLTLTASQATLLRQALQQQLALHADELRPFVIAAFAVPLVERDYATVHAIVSEAASEHGLAHLAVFDAVGRLVAAQGWSDEMAAAPRGAPLPCADGRRCVPFEAAVVYGGQSLGSVRFGLNYEPVEAAVTALIRLSLMIALACLVPTILAVELLHARVTRPLSQLMRASDQIRRGDYDVALPAAGQREFAGLVESFAQMTAEIRMRVASLTRSEAAQRALLAEAEARERTVLAAKAELQAREVDLARALEEQRALTQQQRRFVAVAAHEFRTPLTIIDGAAQRLARAAAGIPPEELRERIGRIRGAVARMSRLIDETLSTARLEAGSAALEIARLDLATLVREVCDRARDTAGEVEIDVGCPATPISIEGDRRMLEQVFANLVSNAVKYSGQGLRVEVTVGVDETMARVVVSDRGIGIPEDEMPGVFGRFFRATTASGIPGAGLGLSLARGIVERHRGTIEISSRVGSGTTVTVRLPLDSASGGAVAA